MVRRPAHSYPLKNGLQTWMIMGSENQRCCLSSRTGKKLEVNTSIKPRETKKLSPKKEKLHTAAQGCAKEWPKHRESPSVCSTTDMKSKFTPLSGHERPTWDTSRTLQKLGVQMVTSETNAKPSQVANNSQTTKRNKQNLEGKVNGKVHSSRTTAKKIM